MDYNYGQMQESNTNKVADKENTYLANAGDDQKDSIVINENAGISGGLPLDAKQTTPMDDEDFGYLPHNSANIEQVDPQTFVQRMSAGAKEAQEQLDAKFAQTHSHLNDFLGNQGGSISSMVEPALKHNNMAGLTNDFMNSERRDLMGDDGFGEAYFTSNYKKLKEPTTTTGPISEPSNLSEAMNKNNDFDENNYGNIDNGNHYGNDYNEQENNVKDSPSISYNPSPTHKHPVTDALKEQENDKFISSEDLLVDYKDTVRATVPSTLERSYGGFIEASASLVTDLDADQPSEPRDSQSELAKAAAQSSGSLSKAIPSNNNNIAVANKSPGVSAGSNNGLMAASQQPQIISVEDIFYKYGLDAWFKPERLHPRVESLIYWRDVKKSGLVFGTGLITLLAVSCFSVISVLAYLSLAVLSFTIVFRVYKSFMQAIQKTTEGHPFKEYLEYDVTLSQEKAQQFVSVAVAHINGFVTEMRRLFLVEDLVDSLKFGVILCVMTYIGAWFNGMTLVILAFVSLFTLPKVYENNKQSIDAYLDLARSKVAEVTEKIKAAIPIGGAKKQIETESEKDK